MRHKTPPLSVMVPDTKVWDSEEIGSMIVNITVNRKALIANVKENIWASRDLPSMQEIFSLVVKRSPFQVLFQEMCKHNSQR